MFLFPAMKDMRELSYTLSYTYPAMFQYSGGIANPKCSNGSLVKISGPEGKLCPDKVDVLASKLKERVRYPCYRTTDRRE